MCISADASGNIFVAGYYQSPSIPFGSTTLVTAGSFDIYLARLGNFSDVNDLSDSADGVSLYPNPSSVNIYNVQS